MGFRRLASIAASAGALAGLSTLAMGTTGCIQDTDCGICDPDNLILESISGVNYQSDKVHILNPKCEGDNCPAPISKGHYFIEEIIPCEDTEEAQDSPNAAEYCRLSPLVTAFGIEFIFNNLLDPTSIELVRKRPDNPQLFEVYDWKTDVLEVEGPITRFNGDYNKGEREQADTITRLVNLSCIDNLAANGQTFSNADYENPANNPCNTINPVTGMPMKLVASGTIKAARGIWTASGNSCSSPEEGPDTCCTYCDYLLSTKIDRYGVNEAGVPLSPNTGVPGYDPAIQCGGPDEVGTVIDKFAACADFIPSVDRSDEEQTWKYKFCDPKDPACQAAEPTSFKLPLFDLLRETHPDQRPANLENLTSKCSNTAQCTDVHNLSGTECVGTHADTGAACLADAYDDGTCENAVCRPQWMVTCRFDETTTGADVAYCQDRRFATAGTAACLLTTEEVVKTAVYGPAGPNGAGLSDCDEEGGACQQWGAGEELAKADWNENGRLSAEEACQGSLYGQTQAGNDGFACDPYYQGNLTPKPRYERDENLPGPTRGCYCPSADDPDIKFDFGTDADYREGAPGTKFEACIEAVTTGCYGADGNFIEERAGEYAVKFVSRAGGIVYDPAIKGFDWRPADLGGVPRGDIENCAENNTDRLVAPLNRHDGWRAADTFTPENFEDFDRAMCSGQEYTVTFTEPGSDNPAYVIDKADNTLAGKSVYKFETSQFHVQPGSGFPTDNLRIGACDDFSLRFSNKYDSSPENLAKLQLYRVALNEATEAYELTTPNPKCDFDTPPEGACCEIAPVAGGLNCFETGPELKAARDAGNVCATPCLTIDVQNQFIGEVGVQIDPIEFGQFLDLNQTYRMLAPMAANYDQAAGDPSIYQAVFWDACGMPLVAENAEPYNYDFTIDAPKCKEDPDKDTVPLSCDNADGTFNPEQEDIDNDGVGDVIDLCPMAGGDANNTADSDNDGVGNECDSCRQTLNQYNANASAASVPDYMMVRNIPDQSDTDEDGIGDVCDNCVFTPNCESFGPENPYEVASPIAYDDNDVCQRDDDSSMVGDACEGMMVNAFAAGPIGFADQDDFDQDGLVNALDGCPRQPLPEVAAGGEPIACSPETAETDCGVNVPCSAAGICNHIDTDNDGIGNSCDTCPFAANPNQAMEGGSQDDDEDGDFVGEVCEIGATKGCNKRKNARPFGFHRVSALGNCCTTQLIEADEAAVMAAAERGDAPLSVGDLLIAGTCELPEDGETLNLAKCVRLTGTPFDGTGGLIDGPDGNPILQLPVRRQANCSDQQVEALECFQLPQTLESTPGIVEPPPGCEQALEDAGITPLENVLTPLTPDDFADQSNPFDALWQNICFLPQRDQDYDGIGDVCEYQRCEFAFDPDGKQFIDANGRLWPNDGAACNGELAADNICDLEAMISGGDTDTDGMDGGSSSGGGGGGSTGG